VAAPQAVGSVAVARSEVRNSLERLEYHLARGKRGVKGVRREKAYLDALHRQTVRMSGRATGRAYGVRSSVRSFGTKAAEALATGDTRTIGRVKSSILADFSSDGLQPARDWAALSADRWMWVANASACPTCLSKHGRPFSGPFIPSHPSCLCIPQTPAEANASAVRPLSSSDIVSTARQYGDPRYYKKIEDFDDGLISLKDLAQVENVNGQARGRAAWERHMNRGEVAQTGLPGGPQRLADPDRFESTSDYWQRGGTWDPDRQRLHDSIVRKFIDEADLGNPPEFQMMGGGPASGKSTMVNSPDSPVLRGRKAVQIDTDEIKKLLPEYERMVGSGDLRAAEFAHKESSYLSKRILSEVDEARSVVVDGVGDKGVDSVARKVARARERGQKITANYATNDVELASKLSKARGIKTGRKVPDKYLRKTHADVSDTFFDAVERGLFDEAYLVDTNIKGVARQVATLKDGRLVIHDESLLRDFLAKSNTGKRSVDDVKALAEGMGRNS